MVARRLYAHAEGITKRTTWEKCGVFPPTEGHRLHRTSKNQRDHHFPAICHVCLLSHRLPRGSAKVRFRFSYVVSPAIYIRHSFQKRLRKSEATFGCHLQEDYWKIFSQIMEVSHGKTPRWESLAVCFRGNKPPEGEIRLNGSKPPPGTQRHQNKAMQTWGKPFLFNWLSSTRCI